MEYHKKKRKKGTKSTRDHTKPMQKQKIPERTRLPKPKVWEIVSIAKEIYTKNRRQNIKPNKFLSIVNVYYLLHRCEKL